MHELIAKTAMDGRPHLQCWAGSAGAVIYDEGTVSSCEILDGVAICATTTGIFKAVVLPRWTPRERSQGCFCTHESNCYYPRFRSIRTISSPLRSSRNEYEGSGGMHEDLVPGSSQNPALSRWRAAYDPITLGFGEVMLQQTQLDGASLLRTIPHGSSHESMSLADADEQLVL
jgi:hypothetical protein